jgi:hypothetical protein
MMVEFKRKMIVIKGEEMELLWGWAIILKCKQLKKVGRLME